MALVDTFNTLTREYYQPGFPDNIYSKSAFWSEFVRGIQFGAGTKIRVPIESARLGGAWYNEDGVIGLTTPEIATYAEFDWRYAVVPIQLSAQKVDLNAEAGTEQVLNLLDTYIKSAGKTMIDSHLGTDIYLDHFRDDPIYNLDGLFNMCQENAFNADDPGYYAAGYGGILIADMPSWVAHVVRATGSAATWTPVSCKVEVVRDLVNEIVHGGGTSYACGEQPSIIVTTPEVYGKLSRELYQVGYHETISRRSERLIAAGFNTFEIDNIPVVADEHCPGSAWAEAADAEPDAWNLTTGHQMFIVNFDYFFPKVVKKYNIQFDEWLKTAVAHNYTNRLFWWGNAVCTQRRAHGAIYNIDPTVLYDS